MNKVKNGDAFKVTLKMQRRPDGGLRVWSDEVPGLVLSHKDPAKVLSDVVPALEVILEEMLGCQVKAERLSPLPAIQAVEPRRVRRPTTPPVRALPPLEQFGSMEYAALPCH